MVGLFTAQFVALSAPGQGGHVRTIITAYYLFVNGLRRSLHRVSQIRGILGAVAFGVLTQRILNDNHFAELLPKTLQLHVRESFQHGFRAIPGTYDYRGSSARTTG